MSGSTISGNSGPPFISSTGFIPWYGDGGGIDNGGWMTLSRNTVTHNTPYDLGGGIYEDRYASLSILHSKVTNNGPYGGISSSPMAPGR